jgi:hypothetical protein
MIRSAGSPWKSSLSSRAARTAISLTGREAAFDRQTHAEGAIAELKHHGLGRARCRGTRKTQLQLLAAATAINLKRLLSAPQPRTDAQADDSGPKHIAIAGLGDLLIRCLIELDRRAMFATVERSTDS